MVTVPTPPTLTDTPKRQERQIVNPSAYAYAGSNPAPATAVRPPLEGPDLFHPWRVRKRAIGQAACAAAAIAHVTSGCLISLCAPLNGDSSAAMTAFASSA
ncbi:Uncharacterised protein [Mycobacteroides abscessus subsp. abscessus]|nr:Uncharacterised protein [Mycobacteroides abscessus subsp. abscessus]